MCNCGGEEKKYTMRLDDRKRYCINEELRKLDVFYLGITSVPFIAILLPRLLCGPISWSNIYFLFLSGRCCVVEEPLEA
jgi:hypothetical protein